MNEQNKNKSIYNRKLKVLMQKQNSRPPHHKELNFSHQLSGLVQLPLLQHSAVEASDIMLCTK